ncbi:MAG: hypothetical protein OEZ32_01015 [Nitrospinota bacterium]|nr:hypothetical protein [Nitrospinota bacterium]
MNQEPFLRPRLMGPRFEGHAIPLEFLRDLAVLDEMIVEVAKWKYLQRHQERKRIPRGFTKGIELKLEGLEDGSAIVVISLFVSSMTLLPPENKQYFTEAKDSIVAAIEAADQNKPIINDLPESALSYFDRIGRSLRDGESIEFDTNVPSKPARLTKESRHALLSATKLKEFTDETTIIGTIPEADQDNLTFEIQMNDKRKVKAPLATQHQDVILEAFNGYKTGARVQLQGIGKYSREGRLKGFESIEHVSALDPLDISARLDELRTLKAGWLDGKGLAPRHDELDWLAREFENKYPDGLPLPYIYPTAEGGIQAEWSLESTEITLEIDLEERRGSWHAMDLNSDYEEIKDLSMDIDDDWKWIVERIKQLNPKT